METNKEKKDQIFIAFVIVGVLGVIVSNLLSNTANFEILATQSILFAITMYGIFYAIPSIYLKFKKWITSPKIKNLKIEKKYLQDGTLAIVLSNREYRKPVIWIYKLQIADNPLTWFPINIADFPIKSGNHKEIFYIKWDKQHRYFVTADFQNDDYEKVFGYGVYKFESVQKDGLKLRDAEMSKMPINHSPE